MRPAAVIAVMFLLLPFARGQQAVPDADDDLARIKDTLAHRIEEARELKEAGKLERADALYQDVLTLFEAADPLAAQTWLRAAACKAELGEKDRAIELLLDVLDRFSHIPWATSEAEKRLAELGVDDPATARPAKRTKGYRLELRNREISVDFKEAKLANVQAVFKKAFQVPLDIDPALADRLLTVRAEKIAVYDALAMIAGKLGAKIEPTATGYRLVATTRPVKRTTDAPAKYMARKGELTREEIVTVVRANLAAIQACYEQNLITNPDLAGKLVLGWTIDPQGKVRDARVETDTLKWPKVGECIRDEINTWKFPKPRGGGVVKVTYPFIFKAVGF